MAKDPAVLFYTSDFLSGTFTMDNEQVGKYIRLLCLQHQKGKLTEKDMLSICKAYDIEIWDKFKLEDGLYYNERMYNETIRRQKFSESRRNNAKSPKKESTSEAYAEHMETETENRTITINENINIDFEWFWNEYDKKVGEKQKLKKKWNKLSDEERQNAMNYLDLYKEAVPDKQFRKNPETFLNNKSWNDEIITRNNTTINKLSYAEREWDALKNL
jgi:predicted nuclease with TOPRIM domain